MKTYSPRPEHIERRWYVIDANGSVLGRLASHVATILRGKHKPIFAPHMDTGDHVIVINARGVRLTGGKEESKLWYRHSGYPGGLRRISYARLLAERPGLAVEKAIKGMLPKNRLGRRMFGKLSVYEGSEHPHQAQKPVLLQLGEFPKWEGFPKPKPPPMHPAKPGPARGRGARGAPAAAEPTEEAPARPGRKAGAKAAPSPRRGGAKAATARKAPSKAASAKRSSAPAATRAKAAPRAAAPPEARPRQAEEKPAGKATEGRERAEKSTRRSRRKKREES